MSGLRWPRVTFALPLSLVLTGCVSGTPVAHPSPTPTSGVTTPGVEEPPPIWAIQTATDRPVLATLQRSGDGSAALALVLQTSAGSVAHVALAALLEARLQAAGISAEGRGDRDSVRVVVLGQGAAEIQRAIQAAHEVALRPVSEADKAGIKLASARVAALRAWSLEDARLEDFAACTGDPSLPPGTTFPRLEGAEGATQLEAWRKGFSSSRSALGVVGPQEEIEAAKRSVSGISGWPSGASLPAPQGPSGEGPVVYTESGRQRGSYRVSVAAWFPGAELGPRIANALGSSGAPVRGRLRAAQARGGLRRVAGVARRGGSCVLASAEGSETRDPEQEAALVAAILQQEMQAASLEAGSSAAPNDPREAAVAGAWWSLTQGAEEGTSGVRWRLALGLAPATGGPSREGKDSGDPPGATRFLNAWQTLQKPPVVEVKSAQEQGQGRLWMLLASDCPISEVPGEHGITALSLLAALGEDPSLDGVSLEPWLTPEGAGVLAGASLRPGETPVAAGQRLANAVGRAWLGAPPSSGAIQEARSLLLGRLGERPPFPSELWAVLAPDLPGRMWVGGSVDGVARPGVEAVRQRWTRLVSGPLRAALLVDQGLPQSDAALQALRRWIPPSVQPRECPSAPLSPPGAGGALLHSKDQAFVAFRVSATGRDVGNLAVTALLLDAPGGLLSQALEGSTVSGSCRAAGQGAESSLIVELRGPREALDGAIERTRAIFEKLPELAKGDAWGRARARWEQLERTRLLDPRERLRDLWSGAARPAVPGEPAWQRWVQEQLPKGRAVVLKPKQ